MSQKKKITYEKCAKILTSEPLFLHIFSQRDLFTNEEVNEIAKSSIGTRSLMFYNIIATEFEICSSVSPGKIFLFDNLSLKIVEQYLTTDQGCKTYIKNILEVPIRAIIENKEDLDVELDARRIKDVDEEILEEKVKENKDRVSRILQLFCSYIFNEKSSDQIPAEIRILSRYIREFSHWYKWDPIPLIGSLLILRFINPAIAFPEKKNIKLKKGKIPRDKRKVLVLMSKIMANLATQKRFTNKLDVLNPDLENFQKYCNVFLNTICYNNEQMQKVHKILDNYLDENVNYAYITNSKKKIWHCNVIFKLLQKKKDAILKLLGVDNSKKVISFMNVLPDIIDVKYEEDLVVTDVKGESSREIKYKEIIEEARTKDFKVFDHMNIVNFLGDDKVGRPICLIKEPMFKNFKEQSKELFPYLLLRLDEFVEGEYIIVYCFNHEIGENIKGPGYKFFVSAYQNLPRKMRKNIKGFYVIHPPQFVRFVSAFLRPFVNTKFWKKYQIIYDVRDIRKSVKKRECPFPLNVVVHNIKKNHPNSKPTKPIFDVSIEEMMERKGNRGRNVPQFLEKLIEYIKPKIHIDGLFRQVGSSQEIEELKRGFDHHYNIDLRHSNFHSVCGLLKKWFRDMKDPLLTNKLHKEFTSVKFDNKEIGVKKITEVCGKLPEFHYNCACILFRFLKSISKKYERNRMNSENIARCFAPNVLREGNTTIATLAFGGNVRIIGVVDFMIENAYLIFPKKVNYLSPEGKRKKNKRETHRIEKLTSEERAMIHLALNKK